MPNLTIHDDRKAVPPPHVDAPRKVVLYSDRLRSLPVSTLSVPLRPASRTIPPSIEARFQGRNVYTMVIPIENLPEYTTDWIIWFAEHDSKPGAPDVLNVRAPIPLRKFESVEMVPAGARTELRVQIAGGITKEGKLEIRNRGSLSRLHAMARRWISTLFSRYRSAFRHAWRKALPLKQAPTKEKSRHPARNACPFKYSILNAQGEDYAFACAARRF